jgi:hypothetical protein
MADALPEAPTPAPTKKPNPDRLNRVDSPGRPILQDFEGNTIVQEIAARGASARSNQYGIVFLKAKFISKLIKS